MVKLNVVIYTCDRGRDFDLLTSKLHFNIYEDSFSQEMT